MWTGFYPGCRLEVSQLAKVNHNPPPGRGWAGLGWAGLVLHILVFNHHFSSPVKRAGLDMDGHATTSFPYCLSPSYFLTEGQFCGSQQYCWTLLSVVLRDLALCLENSEIVSRAVVSCYLSGTTGNFTQRNYILLKISKA